ncbi:uncharacterized protein LOC115624287 [Scaptodrosophila lebanonensis]|uniref:Uncharacterized protein LOC115624287 n=1 Tax=Drosophila lebanonensis TaxID=7225 RepID=A0A6J2TH47_DROLE|nr:uncharacterized protein LOC115624287 [Scaptodrosophila lebanonensis]
MQFAILKWLCNFWLLGNYLAALTHGYCLRMDGGATANTKHHMWLKQPTLAPQTALLTTNSSKGPNNGGIARPQLELGSCSRHSNENVAQQVNATARPLLQLQSLPPADMNGMNAMSLANYLYQCAMLEPIAHPPGNNKLRASSCDLKVADKLMAQSFGRPPAGLD